MEVGVGDWPISDPDPRTTVAGLLYAEFSAVDPGGWDTVPEDDALSPPPARQSPIGLNDPRRLWFFLSYSRSSGPTGGRGGVDRLVKRLFQDLNETVAELTTEAELNRHMSAGFMDQEELRTGA